ncbi:ABC-type taurine transport system ATPase subunit [Caulobacter segnis]|nr:ABC-type taurine transport system ATPase subunit [Caulobacter segnis]
MLQILSGSMAGRVGVAAALNEAVEHLALVVEDPAKG